MNRSHFLVVILVLISTLLAACSADVASPVKTPTASPIQAQSDPNPAAGPSGPTLAASPTASTPQASPELPEPPGDAVMAALSVCVVPECEYPKLVNGSRQLTADSATPDDRWCIQASFTLEGQQQQVAVVVAEAVSSTPEWRPSEPLVGVDCETVE